MGCTDNVADFVLAVEIRHGGMQVADSKILQTLCALADGPRNAAGNRRRNRDPQHQRRQDQRNNDYQTPYGITRRICFQLISLADLKFQQGTHIVIDYIKIRIQDIHHVILELAAGIL